MIFAPVRLGETSLNAEAVAADKKSCKRFGPCGVGEEALYLNNFLIDRHYYVALSSVRRVFKRVAMSQGGFSGKGVFGAIPYLVVQYDDGQEIVQDVMVWLWENREMHTFEISPKSYLFKAVKNRCLTLISRNEIKQKIINTLYDNQQLEYEDPDFYIVEELSRKIEEALQRLPDSYREAFELNRFQHMTYGEIATCLEVSSKTVDYRIQQALKLLRVELKDYLPILLAIL